MAAISWNDIGERFFETGCDRGVLYLSDNTGVAWNGLTSVDETGGTETPNALYFDGRKYVDLTTGSIFTGTLKALTYPDEFLEYDGYAEIEYGMLIDGQARKTFGLSYRTLVGNDVDGIDYGYKIHLFYNLTAVPDSISRSSIDNAVDPMEFSWKVVSNPRALLGRYPSGHVILDSNKLGPETMTTIENILYGTLNTTPRLPTIEELATYLTSSLTIVIVDNGNGTWTAIGPDEDIIMLDSTTFQITNANATFIDANTYQVSSS